MTRATRTMVLLGAAFVGPFVGGCGEQAPEAVPERAVPSPRADPREAAELPALVARVDAEGFFEIEDPTVAEAHSASASVRAVVGRLGRLEPPDAADARVWVRAADGSFEPRRLVPARATPENISAPEEVHGTVRERALAAIRIRAASWGSEGTADAFARLVAGEQGTDPRWGRPTPDRPYVRDRVRLAWTRDGDPVPGRPGADLAAWAPADRPFIRFRSVEAAYRFTSEADRLAARLLAVQGDGRDWGTLRWALHDLLLPTIWRTNPAGERGVGECAVIADTPWIRGRGGVAVLLRITDPDLHRMQTLAGIGQEAESDHLWRPERDPFPGERDRRNCRETREDVEWVAAIGDGISGLFSSRRRVAADAGWRRAFSDASPPRDEAFRLYVAAGVREELRRRSDELSLFAANFAAEREERGLRALAKEWGGSSASRGANVVPTLPDPSPLLARLVSARATTDVKGALVEATFEDDASARAAEEALAAAARPFEGAGDVCRTNLRDLVPLAVCESVPATDIAERSFVVLGWKPVCPCGGTYLVHPVTRETSCSLHGSVRKPLPEPPAPGPLLRDLTRDGATVRFRWPIDWDRRE